ncbi:NAD(P)H-binding protein [Pokkaliibacter sp. CJK22405]|uniref:NAD(P)H-binding protein n=1 Tax=Pokkaliibacter sp. CJK22405 TaxID=3384615 RepID=UPI003985071F
MSKVFVIGATGGVGSRLVPRLIANGHQVSGTSRSSEKAQQLQSQGAHAVEMDLMAVTTESMIEAVTGHEVIVFSAGAAGSGADRTTGIDGKALATAVKAAEVAGCKRFYLVSAFMDAGRDKPRKEGFEHYMATKRQADTVLAASSLDWVIVRPGTLVSEEGNGAVNAGMAIPYGSVARGNVAGFLASLIDNPEITREVIELTDGETPVHEAVKRFKR